MRQSTFQPTERLGRDSHKMGRFRANIAMHWALILIVGLAAAATLSGCYSKQSYALSFCKGEDADIERCMERDGYLFDPAGEPHCALVYDPARFADCYRPKDWIEAAELKLENLVAPPTVPPHLLKR